MILKLITYYFDPKDSLKPVLDFYCIPNMPLCTKLMKTQNSSFLEWLAYHLRSTPPKADLELLEIIIDFLLLIPIPIHLHIIHQDFLKIPKDYHLILQQKVKDTEWIIGKVEDFVIVTSSKITEPFKDFIEIIISTTKELEMMLVIKATAFAGVSIKSHLIALQFLQFPPIILTNLIDSLCHSLCNLEYH